MMPRSIGRRMPPTLFIQPNASSIRLRMRWLATSPAWRVVRPSMAERPNRRVVFWAELARGHAERSLVGWAAEGTCGRTFIERSSFTKSAASYPLSAPSVTATGRSARGSIIASRDALGMAVRRVALRNATQPSRMQAAWSMDDIARTLVQRPSLDLDAAAVEACAALMLDAEKVAPKALLLAAGHLMPVLLRSRDRPISPMIVATFPSNTSSSRGTTTSPTSSSSSRSSTGNRCKAARYELVDAFMSSSWPPSDLVLIACHTGEVLKILRRIGQQQGGNKYLKRITSEAQKIPNSCRLVIESE